MRFLSSLLCCVFLLSGCVHYTEQPPLDLSWSEREQQLSALTDWQFRGHGVFKMPEHKFSANVFWQENADVYKVMLFGPFGLGAVSLDGGPDGVKLKDSHGKIYHASNPEALMQQQLGWSLPVSSLYYWVRGFPAPGTISDVNYDVYHRISHLEQQGWHIDYFAYQRIQDLELPKDMTFIQGRYSVHLTIEGDSWQVS